MDWASCVVTLHFHVPAAFGRSCLVTCPWDGGIERTIKASALSGINRDTLVFIRRRSQTSFVRGLGFGLIRVGQAYRRPNQGQAPEGANQVLDMLINTGLQPGGSEASWREAVSTAFQPAAIVGVEGPQSRKPLKRFSMRLGLPYSPG